MLDDAWLERIDAFLFDCDGVLWRGDEMIPGASKLVAFLREQGKKVLFVTNNSTKSRATYVEKMKNMGISTSKNDIITSASATASYLSRRLEKGSSLYVIGESGLVAELESIGFSCCSQSIDTQLFPTKTDPSIRAVVVGLDRSISYYKLAYGTICLLNESDCLFVATNSDPTMPGQRTILPGAGAIIASLQTAVGRPPDVCVGKPSHELLDDIISTYSLNPSRTCMIGDRLSTDIRFGNLGGLQTILVFSGVTDPSQVESIQDPAEKPHYCVQSVRTLLDKWKIN